MHGEQPVKFLVGGLAGSVEQDGSARCALRDKQLDALEIAQTMLCRHGRAGDCAARVNTPGR